MSLKQKWPISLQSTTQCAYKSYKIWDFPSIFNVPNIKRITLILFLQCYILYNALSTADLIPWGYIIMTPRYVCGDIYLERSRTQIPAKDSRQMRVTRMEWEESYGE